MENIKGWLYEDWPLTVVPLEENPNNPRFVGTGFLVIYEKLNIPLNCLITNRHNVEDRQMMYRINYDDGSTRRILIEERIEEINIQTRWIFHPDDNVDLAICIVRSDPGAMIRGLNFDIIGSMDNSYEGDDIFYIGFPIGIGAEIDQQYHPIVRTGTIAQKRYQDKFLFEATIFPGSSGSPIFKKPYELKTVDKYNDLLEMKLIGIVSKYIVYKDVAISQQTREVRVVFSENSGLAEAFNAELILDIFESDEFRDITAPLLEFLSEHASGDMPRKL